MKKHITTLIIFLSIVNFLQSEENTNFNTCPAINQTKTIEEFEYVSEKDEATHYRGGIFREKNSGTLYLIKYSPLYDSIPEYISGEILSYILGPDRVGQYEYIWDQEQDTYATGSPWLFTFETFENILGSNHLMNDTAVINEELLSWEELLSCIPHGCKIAEANIVEKLAKGTPSTIDGKLLVGFDEVIIASIFVNDQDFNPSNIGFLKQNNRLIGAKVDHGETLNQLDTPISLAKIRQSMCMLGYWKWELNFEETLCALKKIASLENLDEIIEASVEHINQYVDIIEFCRFLKIKNLQSCTITDIKQYLKRSFKIRQNYFQYIADSLEMENAIKKNDLESVKDLLKRGVPAHIKIDSFFNWNAPIIIGFLIPSEINATNSSRDYDISMEKLHEFCQQEEPVSPLEYAKTLGATEIASYLEECISNPVINNL